MKSKSGIRLLTDVSGEYKKWSLLQRKEFMELKLDQESDIILLYEDISREIAREIAKGNRSTFDIKRLKRLQISMNERMDELNGQLTINFDKYIKSNVETGSNYAKQITLDVINRAGATRLSPGQVTQAYQRLNAQAVEAMWSRSRYGLKLETRIWNQSKIYKQGVNNILINGVAEGKDCVSVARSLETYIKKGKSTLAKDYPEMISRMKRVPENISYEALRLARTEMAAAYGMGTMKSAELNPVNEGIQFMLSSSHPEYDICDEICDADNYGLGPGVYPIDKAPDYPFHPNCLCIATQKNADPDDLIDRLKRWTEDPESDRELEEWYQTKYIKFAF